MPPSSSTTVEHPPLSARELLRTTRAFHIHGVVRDSIVKCALKIQAVTGIRGCTTQPPSQRSRFSAVLEANDPVAGVSQSRQEVSLSIKWNVLLDRHLPCRPDVLNGAPNYLKDGYWLLLTEVWEATPPGLLMSRRRHASAALAPDLRRSAVVANLRNKVFNWNWRASRGDESS